MVFRCLCVSEIMEADSDTTTGHEYNAMMCMYAPHKTKKPFPKPCDRKGKKQITLLQRNKMKDFTYSSTCEKTAEETKGNVKQVIQSLIS